MPKLTFENKITWGNLLTLATILIGGIVTFVMLQGSVVASASDIDQLTARVAPIVSSVDGLETRMAVVERNQVTGKEQREAFQDEAKGTLELLRQQNVVILQSLSAITARLDERDREK